MQRKFRSPQGSTSDSREEERFQTYAALDSLRAENAENFQISTALNFESAISDLHCTRVEKGAISDIRWAQVEGTEGSKNENY